MSHHVVVNYSTQPPRIECQHCGWSEELALPMPLDWVIAIMETTQKRHRECEPREGSDNV